MKFMKFIKSWLKRRYKARYSKELPYFKLLNIAKWGIALGILVLTASFIVRSSSLRTNLFNVGAVLMVVSAIADGIVVFMRETKSEASSQEGAKK